MWQMVGIGPMFGQASYFREYAIEREPLNSLQYGIDRYTNESHRLYKVLDKRLDKITPPESTQLPIWLYGLGVASQVGEGLTPTISQMLGIGLVE